MASQCGIGSPASISKLSLGRSGWPFDGDVYLPSARRGQIKQSRAKQLVRRGGGGGRFDERFVRLIDWSNANDDVNVVHRFSALRVLNEHADIDRPGANGVGDVNTVIW